MASFPPSEPMNEFWPRRRHSWLAGVALGLLFATSTAGVHAEVEPVENNTANPTTGNGCSSKIQARNRPVFHATGSKKIQKS